MAILNITYNGLSVDYDMDVGFDLSDVDVRRIAVELIQSGDVRGLHIANLPRDTFASYVVDRVETAEGGKRIYLRPKVPFGGR
jgi:hypothetical protein